MNTPIAYPKRQKFFAHKFCRAMLKMCIANELGADVCWLLTVIAHTEDAGGYRKPVTFFNSQLASVCGFGSIDKLERARKKAISAGWLNYIPGRRDAAPRYFVVIPDRFSDLDDLPSDDGRNEYGCTTAERPQNDRTGADETAGSLRAVCG